MPPIAAFVIQARSMFFAISAVGARFSQAADGARCAPPPWGSTRAPSTAALVVTTTAQAQILVRLVMDSFHPSIYSVVGAWRLPACLRRASARATTDVVYGSNRNVNTQSANQHYRT